jgi:succinoglycan biosynthesis transport protein ExoP
MQSVQTIQESVDLRFYWRQIRKRPWLIITVMLVCLLLAGLYIAKTEPVYEAHASLLIEREESKVAPFEGFVAPGSTIAHYETQYNILKSRTLARRVIDKLGLRHHPEFVPDPGPPGSAVRQSLRSWLDAIAKTFRNLIAPTQASESGTNALAPPTPAPQSQVDPDTERINTFLEQLQVRSDPKMHLVNVGFKSHDPALAADITNTLARLYIDFNMELRFSSLQDALDWLQDQVRDMRQQVEDSEQALQTYKNEQDVYLIDDRLPSLMQELTALGASVAQVKAERVGLQTLYQKTLATAAEGGSMGWLPEVVNNNLIQSLKTNYAQIQHAHAQLSQKYGQEHPRVVQLQAQLDTLKKGIEQEVDQIVQASNVNYQLVKAREDAFTERINTLQEEVKNLNEKSVMYGVLQRDAESNRRLSDLLMNRLKEASMSADLTSGNNIRVIDAAEVPTKATNVRPTLTLGLAGITGLVLGVGLVAFIGFLDSTLKTPDEAEEFLGLPMLGVIERFRHKRGKRATTPLLTVSDNEPPHSQAAEALRGIRANLLFSYADPPRKVFLVTSPHPYDGKTTVATNLAVVMAQAERRVLLVDADMRNPSIHRLFDVDQQVGLSELLLTEHYVENVRDGDDKGLTVIPAGEIPPNPSELLSSKRMARFLDFARDRYDIIIIDTPPVLAVSDAVVLSALVDGILLILRANTTPFDHAKRAVQSFLTLHADPLTTSVDTNGPDTSRTISLGLVMNFLDPRENASYGYYGYRPYYYH